MHVLSSGTKLKHYFEGGYLGGYGRTVHQEQRYWIDRASSVTGTYSTYKSVARIINNTDDTTPNSVTYSEVPGGNAEWCFKTRGQAGGVKSDNPYYWGPLSKAYCVARNSNTCNSSNVFFTSDRNGNAYFRVWNFSGSTITNVVITLDDANKTRLCELGSIASGDNKPCSVNLGGPGYVLLYYNGSWLYCDTVGYAG